jgi:hypothetical protein
MVESEHLFALPVGQNHGHQWDAQSHDDCDDGNKDSDCSWVEHKRCAVSLNFLFPARRIIRRCLFIATSPGFGLFQKSFYHGRVGEVERAG